VRLRRRFGYPGRIDTHERVWLIFEGVNGSALVHLNSILLGCKTTAAFEFEVTNLLQPRNELIIEIERSPEAGLWEEAALEVRATAFLQSIRVWTTSVEDIVELHCNGKVVGTSWQPLDLYLLLDRSTLAYTTAVPTAEGAPFALTGTPVLQAGQATGTVKVDLVNGATVWYTFEQNLTLRTGRDN
jgi:hypothetical protein